MNSCPTKNAASNLSRDVDSNEHAQNSSSSELGAAAAAPVTPGEKELPAIANRDAGFIDTSTDKRRAANRRNAQKSTGPRTPAGIARSSLNARRHGILSREVLLPNEDPRALDAQRKRMWEDWQPVGATEESLVDAIVAHLWRLARFHRVETGIFAYRYAVLLAERVRKSAENFTPLRLIRSFLEILQRIDKGDKSPKRVDGSTGREKDDTATPAPALGTDESPKRVDGSTGREKDNTATSAPALGTAEEAEARGDGGVTGWRVKGAALAAEAETAEAMRHSDAALWGRAFTQDADKFAILARYAASLQRELIQCVHELQRLQAARRGQPVALPAALDVSLCGDPRAR